MLNLTAEDADVHCRCDIFVYGLVYKLRLDLERWSYSWKLLCCRYMYLQSVFFLKFSHFRWLIH